MVADVLTSITANLKEPVSSSVVVMTTTSHVENAQKSFTDTRPPLHV